MDVGSWSVIFPIVPQFNQKVGLFDTEKFPYVIEQGERAMEEQLPYLKRVLALTNSLNHCPRS